MPGVVSAIESALKSVCHAVDGQTLAKIDVSTFAKASDRLAGVSVEAVEEVHHPGVNAAALRHHSST